MTCVCDDFGGLGYYLDRRCKNEVCDHRRKKVVGVCTNDEGQLSKVWGGRTMRCPKRPCKCHRGTGRRRYLKFRIQKQLERFELTM